MNNGRDKSTFSFIVFLLMACVFLAAILRRSSTSVNIYKGLMINGKISSIIDYNRGQPTVIIRGQQITLKTTFDCRNYLQMGDSIIKESNSTDLTVLRDSADFRVITSWSIEKSNTETGRGLIEKITVKK